MQTVGVGKAVRAASAFGFGDLPVVPSVALGAGEVTVSSITSAYGAFANGGAVYPPTLIRRVEDADGQVLFEGQALPLQAIRPVTAYLMADMLRGVIDAGTGYGARQLGFSLPAGGKTGTTNDYRDAWFIGFTPSIVTGVWVGYDQPHTIRRNGYAAELAVPMWARFMKAATKGHKAEWVDRPRGATPRRAASRPRNRAKRRSWWSRVFGVLRTQGAQGAQGARGARDARGARGSARVRRVRARVRRPRGALRACTVQHARCMQGRARSAQAAGVWKQCRAIADCRGSDPFTALKAFRAVCGVLELRRDVGLLRAR